MLSSDEALVVLHPPPLRGTGTTRSTGRSDATLHPRRRQTTVLAAATFTLSWTHSVEKTRWEETWRIAPAGL